MKALPTFFLVAFSAISAHAASIKLTYPNWIDGVAITYLAAAVLEDEFGYEVELTEADVTGIFASVASGEQDAFLNAWLPYTQSEYFDQFSLQLERFGTVLERTRIGLAVPEYMEIESIAELADVADILNGTITGIEGDSGTTKTTEVVIREYGLPFKQVTSSTEGMLAALDAAIAKKEPIVVTAWTPHWMFARYEIKMLNDTSNLYIEDGIRKFARLGFTKDFPEAALFLNRFALSEDQLNEILFAVSKRPDQPELVVREWLAANADLVEAWTKPEEKKGFFRSLFN